MNTIFYCLKQGVRNIFRNKLFTLASISTMAACIFLFGLFFAMVANVQYIVKHVETNICVTVFFDKNISENRMKEIGEEVGKRVEVAEIQFISAEEAWDTFKVDYFKGKEEVAKAFTGDNPLANSASYTIYLNDASMQGALVTYLEHMDGVREVKKSDFTASSFSNFSLLLGYVSAAIIAILLAVAVFLIGNTVSVGITVRREEISIMKLIGATDFFVKAPFLVEGILIGVIGAALPLVVIYFGYEKVVAYILEQFSMLGNIIVFLPAEEIFRYLFPVGLVLGVGIGYLGSSVTIRKHLRV